MGEGRGAGPPRPGGGMPGLGPADPQSGKEGSGEHSGLGPWVKLPVTPRPPVEPTLGILQGFGDSVPWKEGTSWLGSSRSLWQEALSRP